MKLNSETEISFIQKSFANTLIEIYDILSRRVATYPIGFYNTGKQKVRINMNGFQNGFYYFIIRTNNDIQKGVVILQK
ncbi:MAG: hypothetical protein M1419_09350 [Bacteroidetes bacterium]|nr:hypothetical protein [Bacteroidota bacterium]